MDQGVSLDALLAGAADGVTLANLGISLVEAGRAEDGELALRRAARLLPDHPLVLLGLGLSLQAQDRLEEAAQCYGQAVAIQPGLAQAWNNLGNVRKELMELDRALECFERALAVQPDFARARFNRALALLALGRRAEGWREFECRHQAMGAAAELPGPRWEGAGPVVIHAEGGLGDTIHFLRHAIRLGRSGVEVHLRVQPALLRLAGGVPGIAGVEALGVAAPAHCRHLWLLSLPAVIGEGDADGAPYLPAPAPVARTGRRRVALCWAGNPRFENDRRRSIPFSALAPLFAMPEVEWVSLQLGERAQDCAGSPVADWSAGIADMADTAAALRQVDLLVSVDTGIAHLAGAVGVPTRLLLPFSPDWRWGLVGDRTPLYDCLRLIRQTRRGDWAAVVAQVARELEGVSCAS